MMTRIVQRSTPYLFLAPAVLVLATALFYPICYMVYASFLDWNPSQRIGEADWRGFGNYLRLLSDEAFHESFAVTLKFAAIVVSVEMVLGVGLALLLDLQCMLHVMHQPAAKSTAIGRPCERLV